MQIGCLSKQEISFLSNFLKTHNFLWFDLKLNEISAKWRFSQMKRWCWNLAEFFDAVGEILQIVLFTLCWALQYSNALSSTSIKVNWAGSSFNWNKALISYQLIGECLQILLQNQVFSYYFKITTINLLFGYSLK